MDTTTPTALRRRLYALGFVDEFGPVYALYTIWFLDNGVTTAQISTVFVLWAAIAILFEVPSGAIADLVDRRLLLAFAFLLRATGIAVWMLEPSFAGVIIGASLWSIHSSLASGAWEAMIHDQLVAVDVGHTYATVMARISQLSSVAIALSSGVATLMVHYLDTTIRQLGWITVAIHAIAIAIVIRLPDVRWVARDGEHGSSPVGGTPLVAGPHIPIGQVAESPISGGAAGSARWSLDAWRMTIVQGVREARRSRVIARLLALGSIFGGLFVFDEYVPLLGRERGAGDATIPILILVVVGGAVVGAELAARRPHISGRTAGLCLMVGAAVMAAAVVSSDLWPLALIGLGYASLEMIWVISDARVQEHIPAATRATVTSVRSFFANAVSLIAFVVITAWSGDTVPIGVLVVMALVLFVAGAFATRWIPPSVAEPESEPIRPVR